MKKFILATAVMLCVGVSAVRADKRLIPTAEAGALATADYGGVDYSTYTISTLISGTGVHYGTVTAVGLQGMPAFSSTTFSQGVGGVFYGVLFPTGTINDFVDVWDSTSSDMTKTVDAGRKFRLFDVTPSTGCSGFSGPPKPIRFSKGLIYQPSRADFPSLNLLFYVYP